MRWPPGALRRPCSGWRVAAECAAGLVLCQQSQVVGICLRLNRWLTSCPGPSGPPGPPLTLGRGSGLQGPTGDSRSGHRQRAQGGRRADEPPPSGLHSGSPQNVSFPSCLCSFGFWKDWNVATFTNIEFLATEYPLYCIVIFCVTLFLPHQGT
jgi:hypothetical protein